MSSERDSFDAVLVLEDGSIFRGFSFGCKGEFEGEVVFNTGMVGYPESLTDPSYHEQFLCLTYPLIGNYGVPSYEMFEYSLPKYFESDRIQVKGLIISELCFQPSHWLSVKTLGEWLSEQGVPGIYGVDTRELTKRLREKGVMLGVLETFIEVDELDESELIKKAMSVKDPNERNLVAEVSSKETLVYNKGGKLRVVLYDCGVKYNIIRCLIKRGVEVIRVPYDTSFDQVLAYKPHGVLISNGPGDPKKVSSLIFNVRRLLETGTPIMGVCLGNQILALSAGADTYKLKYGHRSQNQPALDVLTNRCYITSQNHGYTILENTLQETDFKPWFVNVNDHTNEGIIDKSGRAFAAQFHPENHPGPVDTEFIFDLFVKKMSG
ncbi:MAG: glutamine-hydrolyzing carbamoyl-phosphate synthase small subunit [Candidatus Odinarchaeum yellowstonii]|uniref:Carbamoyl phosphate synthase small chain n=1 Tax=Odinarchaeota yellowstonii (strain LCB_4) TaxID=1841599 RepID=A0AAF0D1L4_ODILC|nr:MAG: glutamine-hydrolyzing carbamoyl-phosphate synthase small subunit [Candidatus Odinarchaeum yellowstonii]